MQHNSRDTDGIPKGTDINETSHRYAYSSTDLKHVLKMVQKVHKDLFGDFDVEERMEGSIFNTVIENESEVPICLMCFKNHPWMLSVPPWDWECWIHRVYGLPLINSWNTLWISLMLWQKEYKEHFLHLMLKNLFSWKPQIQYLLLIIPPHMLGIEWIEKHGFRMYPKNVDTRSCQTFILFVADTILPKYKIRRAVEEDNDEIVEIVKNDSERLTYLYGDYYIAEILTTHRNCGRQIIVAEYEEVVVGVFVLNENVNYELLKSRFELTPFFNFRKFPPYEVDYLFDTVDYYNINMNEDDISVSESTFSNKDILPEEANVQDEMSMGKQQSQNASGSSGSESSDDGLSLETIPSLHVFTEISSDSDDNALEAHIKPQSKVFEPEQVNLYTQHLYETEIRYEYTSSRKSSLFLTGEDQKIPRTKLDTYIGEPNAFVIEVASVTQEHMKTALPKLFSAAYECFPNRDFALICMHPQCFAPAFENLCSRLTPRPNHTFDENVYFQHRDYFYGTPRVRQASPRDYDAIQRSLKVADNVENFLNEFSDAVYDEGSMLSAYVLLLHTKIIGVAILQPFNDIDRVKSQYQLKTCFNEKVNKPYTFGEIKYSVRSCVFNKLSTFFLRELHRMSDFSMIFYEEEYNDTDDILRHRIVNNLFEYMLPVRIKKQPEPIDLNVADEDRRFLNRGPPTITTQPENVILVSLPRISRPTFDVNVKLVVVGAGVTATAFLESLLCKWSEECRLTYTNITLVAPHGLWTQDMGLSSSLAWKLMIPSKTSFRERKGHMITIRSLINQVHGVMTAIDRKNKTLIINNRAYLKYDYLFLMCGEQFQKPGFNPRNVLSQTNIRNFPRNVFIVNDLTDGQRSLDMLRELINEVANNEYNITVFGNRIEAFCCLNALMMSGVPGKNLTFIDTSVHIEDSLIPSYWTAKPFPDSEILDAVRNAIKECGIKQHINYDYEDWDYDSEKNLITGATFKSKYERIHVPCIAMYMYCHRTVSPVTFMAINKAGLTYDGGLVIDSQYKTNDPVIYAAGTMTKYSRKYYADHLCHRFYNLEEVGSDMGKNINKAFITAATKRRLIEEVTGPVCEEGEYVVRVYEKPVKIFCKLPGNLNYLYITKPGKFFPGQTSDDPKEYGRDLVTGNIHQLNTQGFFKIHLNKHNIIESVMCLTRLDVNMNNLFAIWGRHESFFNKMLLRYDMGLIRDFFQFFREPWTFALYHDDFADIIEKIKDLVYLQVDPLLGETWGKRIIDLHRMYNWKDVPDDVIGELEEEFESTSYPNAVKEIVMQYIYNRAHILPMYLVPVNDVHLFFDDIESSPLFKNQ
ncbi:cilia- and flagella-associated protein 61-like [Agrilus planipennis]|uniref:Cilia- and flagella-associated protein 61-like n=1 Tax=Agrilus planipennis TaxID=224129 RepID=A0A1W4W7R4_AGRPL|nr:cilia- and flagella-associated protein 61-like [Agrilus planipennis]